MAAQAEPEIVLYDLACTKGVCFSPIVWRTRLMLNYKRVPYKTVFLEFPDIEDTLKGLGIPPHPPSSPRDYTVPAIHHVPTNTYLMDSDPISQFIETTYPDPPLPLSSDLGRQVTAKTREAMGPAFRTSLMSREASILSPRSEEFFRRTREPALGHPIEDLLAGNKEEETWKAVDARLVVVDELMQTHKDEGPFVLGAQPSYDDFVIAGSIACARVVDEGVFQRTIKYPVYKRVYDACLPWLEKKD